MHIKGILRFRIGIRCNGAEQSCDIGRTAGTAEPFLADGFYMEFTFVLVSGLRQAFQRIHIEEAFAVQSHAAEDAIVKGTFHHVGVFSVCFDFQHSPCKENESFSFKYDLPNDPANAET